MIKLGIRQSLMMKLLGGGGANSRHGWRESIPALPWVLLLSPIVLAYVVLLTDERWAYWNWLRPPEPTLSLLCISIIAVNVWPAMHAAGVCAGIGNTRRPNRNPACASTLRLVAVGMLLLLPIFGIAVGLLNEEDFWLAACAGVGLWVLACLQAFSAVAIGAGVGEGSLSKRPGRRGALVAATVMLLRGCLLLSVAALLRSFHSVGVVLSVACVDAVFSAVLLSFLLKRLSLPRNIVFASRREPVHAEKPAETGLGVPFAAVFLWKFWRDPIYRAERKQRSGVVGYSLVIALGLMGALGVSWHMSGNAFVVQGGAAYLMDRPITTSFASIPAAILAVAVGIISLRGKGQGLITRNLMLTSVSPLRLLTAKVLGSCMSSAWSGVGAVLAGWLAAGAFFYYRGLFNGPGGCTLWPWYLKGRLFTYIVFSVMASALPWFLVMASGAVGIWAGASTPSMFAAMRRGFLLLALVVLSTICLTDVVMPIAFNAWSRYSLTALEGALAFLGYAAFLLAVCRWCLLAATRHVVSQRTWGET